MAPPLPKPPKHPKDMTPEEHAAFREVLLAHRASLPAWARSKYRGWWFALWIVLLAAVFVVGLIRLWSLQ